jgi:hypothetical protein
MSKLIYGYFLLILIGLSSLFQISCKKKCATYDNPDFQASDFAIIPYNGMETLQFIHNQKDTISLKGTGISDSTHQYTDADHCNAYIERYHMYNYYSSDKKYHIKIVLSRLSNTTNVNIWFLNSEYVISTVLLQGSVNYADSLNINKITYFKVHQILNVTNQNSFVLYNVNAGILRIQYDSNDTWDLRKN